MSSATDLERPMTTNPPHTSELAAMQQAAKAGNREHAPAILAAIQEATPDRQGQLPWGEPGAGREPS
jgi:hypothetical protein